LGKRLKEVWSGYRLALIIIAVILHLCVLITGLLLRGAGARRSLLFGVPAVLFSIGILWFTVDRWAKWFFGVCCVTALRAIVMSALGRTMSVPSIVAPRSYLVGLAAASALMAFLSYKFVGAKPDNLESVCLVGALTAIVNLFVNTSRVSTLVSTIVAFSLLSLSWGYGHIGRKDSYG
jgi:hypothetical protein